MRQAELLGQHKASATADHRNAQDHVVADLGSLTGAGIAAMNGALAIDFRIGSALAKPRAAAGHEGQRRRPRAADAAGDRRIKAVLCMAAIACVLRANRVDRRSQSNSAGSRLRRRK